LIVFNSLGGELLAGMIEELQRDALDPSVPVDALLRRVQLAAVKLDLPEVEAWVKNELGGYKAYLPHYRKVTGQLRMWNLYHGWVPVLIQQDELANTVSTVPFSQSIGILTDLVRQKEKRDSTLRFPLTARQVDALSGLVEQGSARFTVHLTRGHITGILDSVRSMILDWGGRMEKEGIVGEAMSFSEAEKEQAKQSLAHIHIRSTGNISGQMGSNGSLGAQTANDSSVFQALADAVRAGVSVGEEREQILAAIKGMERNRGDQRAFGTAYAAFISTAAGHMSLISPFMTALAQVLTS
jgi:hypothetical protein